LNSILHRSISVLAVENTFMMSVSFRISNLFVVFNLDTSVTSSTMVNIDLFRIYKQQEHMRCDKILVCTYLKEM